VGDHGESLGEHGEATHGLFVYQSVMHVPLIIRAPFGNMRGRRVSDPVRIVDVAPTVLDLTGQTGDPATDGKTLVPLMSGAVKELGLEAYSESRYGFERFGWSPLKALRQGRFKLILAPRPELYDLASDPGELTNLYGQRAALATTLTRRLEEIEPPPDAQRAADVPAMDSDTRARLAALGYVSAPVSRAPIDAADGLADPKDRIELYRQFTERSQDERGLP
jgi:choline-sulfatase